MSTTYFLGANSRDGFFSLYGEFCSGKGDFMHIIKGGPGTGKSSFMRKIAHAAEEKGLDVEYVLCSGDPDSLDGIYIPQLKLGWVDGTAPHVLEPRRFGVDSDYVNLGEFCNIPLPVEDASYVNHIYDSYREKYNSAYDYLKAASQITRRSIPSLFTQDHIDSVKAQVRAILKGKGAEKNANPIIRRRFFHAVCCKGDLYLNDSLVLLCKQYYVFDSDFDGAALALRAAAEEAVNRSAEVILSFNPRDTEKLEAVLLPELSLGFVCGNWTIDDEVRIAMDALLPKDSIKEQRSQLKEMRKLEERLMSLAVDSLSQAKALHDELETYYKSAMDFKALDEYTNEYIKRFIK